MNQISAHNFGGEVSAELGAAYCKWVESLPIPQRSKEHVISGMHPKFTMTSMCGIYDHSFLVTNLYSVIAAVRPEAIVDGRSLYEGGILSSPYGEYEPIDKDGVLHIRLPITELPVYLSVISGPGKAADEILWNLMLLPFHMVQSFIPNGQTLILKGEHDFRPQLTGGAE